MSTPSDAVLRAHHALVPSDNAFQREARLLQALWREENGLAIGEHRGLPLGSRLAMPDAELRLTNYLTDGIRDVVRREVLDPVRSRDKLFGRPRIFNDLLSSQPLCFNLFGELARDLPTASGALRALTLGRVDEVTAITFEYSPGRGDDAFTGDRSAFDVFVRYRTRSGADGFVGIEVKYHEALGDPAASHKPRYDEVAAEMGCFVAEARPRLQAKPLQQIWRDHLLGGSMSAKGAFGEGLFAFVYPRRNARCEAAVAAYRECLADAPTFTAWTLEDVVEAVRGAGAGAWIEKVADRYLGFEKIAAACQG